VETRFGKEFVLLLRANSSLVGLTPKVVSPRSRLVRLSASIAVVVSGLMMGCENNNWTKGFVDPSEMAGRTYREKESLTVPILNTLDKGVEEPTDQFANSTEVKPEDLIASSEDYRVGPGDLVSVSVTDLVQPGVESVRTNRVSESGQLSLQLVGPVRVSGYTEAELEQTVRQAYANAGILPNAQVTVTVSEARNRAFTIYGAVNSIGQYAIVQADTRVLDALALARGTTTASIDTLYVIRSIDPAPNAPAPAPAVPGTTTTPAGDPLAPQSRAKAPRDAFAIRSAQGPVLLQTAPASDPGTGGTDDTMIMVDGKPVLKTAASTQETAPVIEPAPSAAAPAFPSPETMTPAAVATPAVTETPAPVATPAPAAEAMAPAIEGVAPAVEAVAPAVEGVSPDAPFAFNSPAAAPKQRVIRVPLDRLRQGDLRYNIVIQPRDLVFVPDPVAGEYYVGGHVARVGVYSLTGRSITLKQAIVSAGMLDQVAIPERTDIIRRIGADKEVFVRVNLEKIFEGQQPDIYLKPNDVVLVGTNWGAPFIAALRNGFRLTYGFGFLYDRNFGSEGSNNN